MSAAAPGALEALRAQAAASVRHPLTLTLLALTFITGLVDAVSFLALGTVFTANMTGNIALLGIGITGAGGLDVSGPLASLGFFLVGAVAGGVLARKLGGTHRTHVRVAIGTEASLVGAAAVIAAVVEVRPDTPSGYLLIAILAFAMGVRNATTRRIGVADLSTTVVTTLMAGLAAESPAAGGSGRGTTRRVIALLAMVMGAAIGALLLQVALVVPLALASALAAVICLVYRAPAGQGPGQAPT